MGQSNPLFKPPPSQRRNAKYLNLIFPIVLIVGFSIFSWLSKPSGAEFDWGEDATTITDPAGDSFSFQYADLRSVTLEDHPVWGRCLSGESRRNWIYGTWENDAWGTYRLLAAPDVDLCIVFQTAQSRYVLSYESNETTRALYDQLLPIIEAAQLQNTK